MNKHVSFCPNHDYCISSITSIFRLSALAGSKLTDGNANIADLSDENRPTKLSERYSELYDNEWTEAFTYFSTEKKMKEEEVCSILVHVFCVSS